MGSEPSSADRRESRTRRGGRWERTRQTHSRAVEAFTRAAQDLPADAWTRPLQPGRWSPAEIAEHVSLAYEVLLRELSGGPGMAVRTRFWQRGLLRLTVLPRLLRRGAFPAGARAPRETRPAGPRPDRAAAIAAFQDLARRIETRIDDAFRDRPGTRLTHAYFGALSLEEALMMCARHLDHHRGQLPGPAAEAGPTSR
jgi:uncharacterized damage-inducible protein DinB